MFYLQLASEIELAINQLASYPILWVDTEVADWQTPNPRLSLIQVLANPTDLTGESTYIFDVLDRPDLSKQFIDTIIVNHNIEKVFHNAAFDLRYLGGKESAQNITCTLKIANNIPLNILGTPDRKLKTLASQLCHFENVDAEEQGSDWSQRPLSDKQLEYAKMDTVYLACVHQKLLKIINPDSVSKKTFEDLTVTKVRIAFECPRLFYLNDHFNGKALFIPDDRLLGIGTIFHQFAEQFVRIAKKEPRFIEIFKFANLDREKITKQIQQFFYELVFFPYLQKNQQQATTLYQIWQGVRQLINKWADILIKNLEHCQADLVFDRTFVSEELNVEHTFNLPNNDRQLVKGKLDSLLFDLEKNRFCVVEYKTYEPIDPAAQLAQVAIYSSMLSRKKQVPIDAAVYCVLPEFKEYYYSWEELQNTVHRLIPSKLQQMQQWIAWKAGEADPPPATNLPHLCKICPQQEKCQSFFGTREINNEEITNNLPIANPTLVSVSPAGNDRINADDLGKKLVTILQSFKIEVDYLGSIAAPAFIRAKIKPSLGVKVSSIVKLADDLKVHLEINDSPLITTQPGYVSIDLPRQDRKIAAFEDYIKTNKTGYYSPIKIAIGLNLNGELIESDLSDPNTCHFLVGGTTGSGKSEFLRSMLLSLLHRYTPQQLQIALVDPKRVTFPEFERIPWLLSPVVKNGETAIELMERLVTEMERRYQIFEQNKCPNIDNYNRQQTELKKLTIPHIVCIFDEYADFMAEKEIRNALEQSIKRLGAMARAAGIHLIIATQRPEAGIVTPIIRSNLPGRIALRTVTEADSNIILGGKETSAAYLLGKGDLLYQVGSQLQRLQSLYAKEIHLPV